MAKLAAQHGCKYTFPVNTLDFSRRMLATMATLMMPAPAPTMPMNPPALPLTPAKHELPPKAIQQHNTSNGQKPGE